MQKKKIDYQEILQKYQYLSDEHIKKRIRESDGTKTQVNQDIINEIVLWKINRATDIDDELLQKIRDLNISTPDEIINNQTVVEIINQLLMCKGVGIAMASTILKMFHPELFPIIDQRAYRTIYCKNMPSYYSKDANRKYIELYSDYIVECLRFNKSECPEIEFENIDKLLYQIDIEAGNSIKY